MYVLYVFLCVFENTNTRTHPHDTTTRNKQLDTHTEITKITEIK